MLQQGEAKETTELAKYGTKLGQAIDSLRETMSSLRQRLSPVLVPMSPTKQEVPAQPDGLNSSLIQSLKDWTREVEDIREIIQDTTNRLEV